MKKVVIIPDSFKGSLTSIEVCDIVAEGIHEVFPDAQIVKIPISDGGEGCVDAFLHAFGGEKKVLTTSGPYLEQIKSFYGVLPNNTVVIEMAASAGLHLTKSNPNPGFTTTLGVGELIKEAILHGHNDIIIGLGGSATNDGGVGLAHALGVRFINQYGDAFIPVGLTLQDIKTIDCTNIDSSVQNAKITALCDVTNPLLGAFGAVNVFAKQKGADAVMRVALEENLAAYAELLDNMGYVTTFPGAGAAGGIPISLKAFFNADIKKGIDTMLEAIDIHHIVKGADLIITGEGKLDDQSLQGKVLDGVAQLAHRHNVPLISIVGQIDGLEENDYPLGLTKVYSLKKDNQTIEEAINHTNDNLRATIESICLQWKKSI